LGKKVEHLKSVNVNVDEEFLAQLQTDFGNQTKLLKAYATLITRLKDRTDAFVL